MNADSKAVKSWGAKERKADARALRRALEAAAVAEGLADLLESDAEWRFERDSEWLDVLSATA